MEMAYMIQLKSLDLQSPGKNFAFPFRTSHQKKEARKSYITDKNRMTVKKLKEETIFEMHIKHRRTFLIYSNAYISISDAFERRNRQELLDKVSGIISSLRS